MSGNEYFEPHLLRFKNGIPFSTFMFYQINNNTDSLLLSRIEKKGDAALVVVKDNDFYVLKYAEFGKKILEAKKCVDEIKYPFSGDRDVALEYSKLIKEIFKKK